MTERQPRLLLAEDYAGREDQVGEARRACRAALSAHPCFDAFTVELIVSELCTNAIRHGRGGYRLAMVVLVSGRLRISVIDSGRACHGQPEVKHPDSAEEGGRGLLLVEEQSERWGVMHRRGGGLVVWADVVSA